MKAKILTYTAEQKMHYVNSIAPWLAGAGFALGHIATTSNCTIPQQGRCATCGSCVIALGSLVAWAVIKNNKEKNEGNK